MFEERTSENPFVGWRVFFAFITIAGVYAVAYLIKIPPVQLPGYLLIVSFDTIVAAAQLDLTGVAFDAAFAGYLYVLSVLAAALPRVVGYQSRHAGIDSVAGVMLVVGIVGVFVAVILTIALPNVVACETAVCESIDWSPVLIVLGVSLVLVGGGVSVAYRRRYA